jgi:hypothetical protein
MWTAPIMPSSRADTALRLEGSFPGVPVLRVAVTTTVSSSVPWAPAAMEKINNVAENLIIPWNPYSVWIDVNSRRALRQ